MKKARTIAAGLVLCVVFAAAHILIGLPRHIEIINAVTVFAMVTIIGTYCPVWWPSIKGHLAPENRLALGIGLLAASILGSRVWSSIWRLSGFPEWMRESWIVAFMPFVGIVACALLITVPSHTDGRARRKSIVLLVGSMVLGALTAGIVIGVTWGDYVVASLPP